MTAALAPLEQWLADHRRYPNARPRIERRNKHMRRTLAERWEKLIDESGLKRMPRPRRKRARQGEYNYALAS